MQAHADRLGRLVERRADVDVLAEAVPAHGLEDQAGQLIDRRDVLHQQDPARLADALDVLADLQTVELALLLVPVGADPLEGRGPVHERVGHDADLGVLHRDEVALEVADQVVQAARRRGVVGRWSGVRRRSRVSWSRSSCRRDSCVTGAIRSRGALQGRPSIACAPAVRPGRQRRASRPASRAPSMMLDARCTAEDRERDEPPSARSAARDANAIAAATTRVIGVRDDRDAARATGSRPAAGDAGRPTSVDEVQARAAARAARCPPASISSDTDEQQRRRHVGDDDQQPADRPVERRSRRRPSAASATAV